MTLYQLENGPHVTPFSSVFICLFVQEHSNLGNICHVIFAQFSLYGSCRSMLFFFSFFFFFSCLGSGEEVYAGLWPSKG